MKCALSVVVVLAVVAVGAWAIPSGYMYYKPGTPGIMYVQYQKAGPGSESSGSGVSAFVAGDSGDTMSIVDDVQKGEDILSEEKAVEAAAEEQEEHDQSISVAQGYNSQSIAVAIPAEESADDYDGDAKVEVAASPSRDYLPPNNEYLPPAVLNEVFNEESDSLTKTEEDVEEIVADDVIPVAIAESNISDNSPVEEVKAAEEDVAYGDAQSVEETREPKSIVEEAAPAEEAVAEEEEKVHAVYGAPSVEETREPKILVEEAAPAEEVPEVKTAEEEAVVVEDTKTVIENEEVPVDDSKTVADESVLVAEEPIPVVKDIPEPVVPVAPVAPTKRTRVFPARRPSFVPQRKKVAVQLEEEDEEAIEYVPVHNRQVAKPKKEVVEEEEQPFPLGGTFFPINFGGTSGGAIAIANSFSTSKGGSSKSQAVAYGSGNDAFRARKPVKSQQADCDC